MAIDQAVTVLPGKTCPTSLPAWINGRRAGVLSGGPDRWGNGCEVGGTLATNLKPGTWVFVAAASPNIVPLLTFASVHAKLAIS